MFDYYYFQTSRTFSMKVSSSSPSRGIKLFVEALLQEKDGTVRQQSGLSGYPELLTTSFRYRVLKLNIQIYAMVDKENPPCDSSALVAALIFTKGFRCR